MVQRADKSEEETREERIARLNDNYAMYGIPRSESGYRTPGLVENRRELDAYIDKISKMVFAKRSLRSSRDQFVSRQ